MRKRYLELRVEAVVAEEDAHVVGDEVVGFGEEVGVFAVVVLDVAVEFLGLEAVAEVEVGPLAEVGVDEELVLG